MAGTQKSPRKEVRRPVWAEVSLSALMYNLAAIRKYVNPPHEKRESPRKILSIVKGNGYGHGGPSTEASSRAAPYDTPSGRPLIEVSSHLDETRHLPTGPDRPEV